MKRFIVPAAEEDNDKASIIIDFYPVDDGKILTRSYRAGQSIPDFHKF